MQPLVIALPDRAIVGTDDLERPARTFEARPLREHLDRRWEGYAHLALYEVPGEERWPRLNKAILPQLRERRVELILRLTALDHDSPGHAAASRADYGALLDRVDALPSDVPKPSFTWRTRAGARLLFVHPPLPPEGAEAFHAYLRDLYEAHGISCDPAAWEWNRLHALPYVVRDGKRLDPEPIVERPPLTELPPFPPRPPAAPSIRALRLPLPEPEATRSLCWSGSRLTEWGRWAKHRLTGRDAAAAFDAAAPALEPGRRNPVLFAWAGSIVAMTGAFRDTTPEHVLGALLPVVEANDRPGLLQETWRAVLYCWAREEAEAKRRDDERGEALDDLRERLAEWADDLPEEAEALSAWIRQRLLVVHGSNYYVLDSRSGRYWAEPVAQAAVVSAVKHSGLVGPGRPIPSLACVDQRTGSERPPTGQWLIDHCSVPVGEVTLGGGLRLGGELRGRSLAVTTYARRSDLGPDAQEPVEAWLRETYGEHLPLVEEWISGALAFEEGPICALSVEGWPGIGKNLLVQGLASAITSRTYTTLKDVLGERQPKLHLTPFVHCDESMPPVRGAAAAVRELIGSWSRTVNRKYVHEVDVRTCPRLIFTANRSSLMQALFGGLSSPEERAATAQRVIHVRVGRGGARYFERVGRGEPQRWLRLDLLAKHFLHLHASVPRSRHGRFLVTGDEDAPFLRGLVRDSAPVVGELLVRAYEAGRLDPAERFSAAALVDFGDRLAIDRTRGLNLVSVGRAAGEFLDAARRPDLAALRAFALNHGMPCERLEKWHAGRTRQKASEGRKA